MWLFNKHSLLVNEIEEILTADSHFMFDSKGNNVMEKALYKCILLYNFFNDFSKWEWINTT